MASETPRADALRNKNYDASSCDSWSEVFEDACGEVEELERALTAEREARERAEKEAQRLTARVQALEEALREAVGAVEKLTEQVRHIAPSSPHAAMVARLNAVLTGERLDVITCHCFGARSRELCLDKNRCVKSEAQTGERRDG